MSRINTNVQSLIAQRVLSQNQSNLGTSLERLSTGLRINSGKDDPAGLIASEHLKSEVTSLNAARRARVSSLRLVPKWRGSQSGFRLREEREGSAGGTDERRR